MILVYISGNKPAIKAAHGYLTYFTDVSQRKISESYICSFGKTRGICLVGTADFIDNQIQ
jgi:hypothetical protein